MNSIKNFKKHKTISSWFANASWITLDEDQKGKIQDISISPQLHELDFRTESNSV